MPKRNNPFGDHSTLQLKTHVGEKEVDKGVCQQTRMQAVYERTQALLFKGMKESHPASEEMAVDINENHMTLKNAVNDIEGSSMRQMHLNKNCELVPSDEFESVEMDTEPQPIVTKPPATFLFGNTTQNGVACCQPLVPNFGCFGRSTGAHSPEMNLVTSAACEVGGLNLPSSNGQQSSHNSATHKNVFSMLMQRPARNSVRNEQNIGGACHNCRQPVQARSVVKCQFCEQYVCSLCVRQCQGCFQHFCHLCSVVNYDQSTERPFCLTCSDRS